MPTLHWIGKEKVINHHQEVPYRVLDRSYDFNTSEGQASENKIIHGDNLEALKSLLPEYEGRVNCIYIDPPYNTGNENWVYNDNVSHPKLKKWLGDVVGKEGEDLSRHDKWLCMMYPRLKLLHKLLAKDGAIFISIDDNEVHFLCLVLDEIFGKTNFVANIVWQKRTSPDARATIGAGHEHIIVYGKSWENVREKLNKLPISEKQKNTFKNPDNDPSGLWVSSDFTAQGFRPNQMYEIITPSGKKYLPPPGRCWRNIEPAYEELEKKGKMWYGQNGDGVPRWKSYLSENEGIASWTWWSNDEVGHSQEGKKEINQIFNSATIFETPKPTRLIERILQLYVNDGEVILDSFAGSGTTAHAVLNLNKSDGGNRKFILIEMEDYADSITAERVKRVIQGYGEGSKTVDGTGGDFSFYVLGAKLFDEEGNLNEAVSLADIKSYIWYSETRTKWNPVSQLTDSYHLGTLEDTAYYFIEFST
jgi:adenine-specific DNA-methyltransferase